MRRRKEARKGTGILPTLWLAFEAATVTLAFLATSLAGIVSDAMRKERCDT